MSKQLLDQSGVKHLQSRRKYQDLFKGTWTAKPYSFLSYDAEKYY